MISCQNSIIDPRPNSGRGFTAKESIRKRRKEKNADVFNHTIKRNTGIKSRNYRVEEERFSFSFTFSISEPELSRSLSRLRIRSYSVTASLIPAFVILWSGLIAKI